jgi:hypothetical protein
LLTMPLTAMMLFISAGADSNLADGRLQNRYAPTEVPKLPHLVVLVCGHKHLVTSLLRHTRMRFEVPTGHEPGNYSKQLLHAHYSIATSAPLFSSLGWWSTIGKPQPNSLKTTAWCQCPLKSTEPLAGETSF